MTPKTRSFWIATVAVVALDQISKALVRAYISERAEGVSIIPNFLSISHAENPGAAFSFLADYEHRLAVFLCLTMVSGVGIAFGLRSLRAEDRLLGAALGTLFSGVVGNAIDRAAAGHVTDMIKVYAGFEPLRSFFISHYRTNVFPIFNVADSAIWVGVIGFALGYLTVSDRGASEPGAPPVDEGSRPTLD